MARSADPGTPSEKGRLVDENEQLRSSLESVLEENALLAEESDHLRERMQALSRELQVAHATRLRQTDLVERFEPVGANRSETEEAMRVAFEELQVMTEELEVANTSLHQMNLELDARVEQRTLQLREMNDALRSTEASLRAVTDLVPDLLWRASAKGQVDWFNQRWLAYTGHTAADARGMRWLDAVHPHDRDVTRTAWTMAVASGEPFEHQHRIRDVGGDYRWFLVRAEPLRDDNGRIVRWFAAGTDIHDHRSAMESLQQSESRFRTLVEGMPQLVWRAVFTGRWTWSSPQWSRYTGQTETEARGMGWLGAFHPDDRDTARTAWQHAQKSGALEMEGRIFHAAEQRYRHFRTRALAMRDATERVLEWIGTSTDVDDILQLQQEQGILVAELQHRTRNLMAVIQAVTARTLKDAPSLKHFEERIHDRLSALARVQGLLSNRETGTRVAFDMLLREELSAHVELSAQIPEGKVSLEGPTGIPLRSATIQTFALALHELATNAVKYGALSDHGGQLKVTWGVRYGDTRGPQLWVDWRETGVADVPEAGARPRGGGYGRELIERALPYQLEARTTFALEPDGVHCTIEVTVPSEHADTEPADDRERRAQA